MNNDFIQALSGPLYNISLAITVINVLLHFIFAAAVARDTGHFHKQGIKPQLVSGVTWAFATLLGGVFVAAIYWVIHHSTFTRKN